MLHQQFLLSPLVEDVFKYDIRIAADALYAEAEILEVDGGLSRKRIEDAFTMRAKIEALRFLLYYFWLFFPFGF